ncbi:MAG: hypothetical protein SGJ01_17205 [Gemmatimonadota bacterium]|nr:hypothetical protein [Gemmatimonadota bacterium]
MTHYRWVLLALLPLAAACGDGATALPGPTPPDSTAPQDSLHFLRATPASPPLADRIVSFWAVKGERRELRLMYRPAPGAVDSVEFARLRVDDRSLVNRPDGTPLADGDSILITMSVVDTLNLIAEVQPAGLVFSPSRPARLWLKYGEADPDLNRDGLVNAADTALVLALKIWKQEQPGDPWQVLPSTVNLLELEVEADIPGFTRYAVSY